MITINKRLLFIRCSKYQYLIKKGSMSNYSYDLIDENQTGILEFLFDRVTYPIDTLELKERVKDECINISTEEIDEYMDNLTELQVLLPLEEKTQTVCLICDSTFEKVIKNKLDNNGFNVKSLTINDFDESIQRKNEPISDEDVQGLAKECDFILFMSKSFRPSLFYKLNSMCIESDKKIVISFLDGDEGIIVPILQPKKTGCYNDFEILRESSFFNLLDYQIMKEECISNSQASKEYNSFYLEVLVNQTILLLMNYSKYTSINNYAYSFDFERMVNTKIRMLKFPKCPSCQGDRNVSHPFI